MKERNPRSPLAAGVAVTLVIAAVFGGLYLLIWQGPQEVITTTKNTTVDAANAGYDLLRRAGRDIYQALQFEPKVIIAGETVHGPATEITEIATATNDFSHTCSYEVNRAGSTKRLELKGDFTAKAGFAVDDSFALEISEDGRSVTVHHQKAALLSCELKKLHVLKDEDGWWNKLQAKERESAQNKLLRSAPQHALNAELQAKAASHLLERFAPLQKEHSFTTKNEVRP